MVSIFGLEELNVQYTDRHAAYIVVVVNNKVAMVKSRQKYFLPGGGSLKNETSEQTICREVKEEIGQTIKLIRLIGKAIQFFYSSADNKHYKMVATFYEGKFTSERKIGFGEHELNWLSLEEIEQTTFHQCHKWAARQLLKTS